MCLVQRSLDGVQHGVEPEHAADFGRVAATRVVRTGVHVTGVDHGAKAAEALACATVERAEQRLTGFEAKWDKEYPPIMQSWRRTGSRLILSFDALREIHKVIYAINAIAAVSMHLRKFTKDWASFRTKGRC